MDDAPHADEGRHGPGEDLLALEPGAEVASEGRGGRVTVRRDLLDRLPADPVELGRRLGTAQGGGHRRLPEHLLLELEDRARLEGERPDEAPVEDEAERVDVGPPVDLLALELLGRHVVGRAYEVAVLREGRPGEVAREAEVGELRAPRAELDEDVLGLHVAVDDPALVGVLEALGDLGREAGEGAPVDLSVDERPLEVLPLDEVHGEPALLPVEAHVVHLDDRGVAEARDRLGLAFEALGHLDGRVAAQHLQGDASLRARVEGAVDDPHASLRDRGLDGVGADPHLDVGGLRIAPRRAGFPLRGICPRGRGLVRGLRPRAPGLLLPARRASGRRPRSREGGDRRHGAAARAAHAALALPGEGDEGAAAARAASPRLRDELLHGDVLGGGEELRLHEAAGRGAPLVRVAPFFPAERGPHGRARGRVAPYDEVREEVVVRAEHTGV